MSRRLIREYSRPPEIRAWASAPLELGGTVTESYVNLEIRSPDGYGICASVALDRSETAALIEQLKLALEEAAGAPVRTYREIRELTLRGDK